MKAELISIGDEILIGQIVNTNATHIAKELNKIGIEVYQISSIQDDRKHILTALYEAECRVQVVLITGGLGPTKDDITKHTLCEYFSDELILDNKVLEHVEELFKKYIKRPVTEINKRQALVPSKAKVLSNPYGTAPGLWLENKGVVFISMPGVPYEMKAMMENHVLPKLQERFARPYILHKTLLTYGLGESAIAERIASWEDALPSNIKLAYLPNLGKVRLRLTAKSSDKEQLELDVNKMLSQLYPLIGEFIYGEEEGGPIEELIGAKMKELGLSLSTAESCTGGLIAERITAIAGASSYFAGGVVSYTSAIKSKILGVPAELIEKEGVVSASVAKAMAVEVRNRMGTDYGLSTTGNAGPTKGDANADLGTVFIGIAGPKGSWAEEFQFGNHREKVIHKAANKAFELLMAAILKN